MLSHTGMTSTSIKPPYRLTETGVSKVRTNQATKTNFRLHISPAVVRGFLFLRSGSKPQPGRPNGAWTLSAGGAVLRENTGRTGAS